MLAPKHDWPALTQPKRITFVIDTSGSMQGEKIAQARAALKFFVESLQPHDWFDVVPFSTEARPFFPEPVPANAENRARAVALAGEIEAKGGTNIEDALARAMRAAGGATEDQVPITVFLTDGLPTVGTTDIDALLAQAAQRNPARHRVFVFGVGNDVNTRLLDSLAERTRGDRDYVREGESIEQKTGTLFEKLAHPVLTDVVLRIEDIEGFDVLPKTTPDLFKGSRLVVVGRYRGAGARAIRLEGRLAGQRREFLFEGTFPADSRVHDFVPALWAQRRVAYLLDQIRLNGQRAELIDEITRLGKQYGLVTPYTSHLIVEEGMRLAQAAGRAPAGSDDLFFGASPRAGEELRRELGRAGGVPMPEGAPAEVAKRLQDERKAARDKLGEVGARHDGAGAVADSATILRLAQTVSPTGPATGGATALVVRRIRDVTLYLAGDVWIDARMRPELRDSARKIVAFSDEYFALLAAHPELAPLLAFSTRLLLLVDDGAVEIVGAAPGSG
jgi:Ca-activated chloride channel family protein